MFTEHIDTFVSSKVTLFPKMEESITLFLPNKIARKYTKLWPLLLNRYKDKTGAEYLAFSKLS